uniref:phosphoethanolamine N-methyltransferase n=1 Tax=Panagrellus redivivus TaxID=6233 RepID=A0A7E4VHQ1_PANRE
MPPLRNPTYFQLIKPPARDTSTCLLCLPLVITYLPPEGGVFFQRLMQRTSDKLKMAVAREIVASIRSNPTAAPIQTAFVATENATLGAAFDQALGTDVTVAHGGPLSLTAHSKRYDAIILSNVLDEWNLIERKHHLSDFLRSILVTLPPNGTLAIRENMAQHPVSVISELTKFFDVFIAQESDGKTAITFDFYAMRQVEDSLYGGQNHLDVYWILTRAASVQRYEEALATFRDFLDQTQYTEDNVRSYEWIFGEDFISPGGIDENRRVLSRFGELKPGKTMLDIGVGIGGGARQAAREFGLHVLGVDLSTNMIVHAFERNQRDKDARVRYQIGDAVVYAFEENSFDYVFSRDCVQHIEDQKTLFAKIYKSLKPGGKLLITRYGKGYGTLTPLFLEYVKNRHYFLHNLDELKAFAVDAGFTNVRTENLTPRFKEILEEERDRTIANKEDFIGRFSQSLYDHHIASWGDKLGFIAADNHNWHLIYAEKPL